MLKILGNTKSTRLGKSKVEIGDNSKNEFINIMVNDNEIDKNEFGNSEVERKKNYQNISRSKKSTKPKDFSDFFTSRARLTFTILR